MRIGATSRFASSVSSRSIGRMDKNMMLRLINNVARTTGDLIFSPSSNSPSKFLVFYMHSQIIRGMAYRQEYSQTTLQNQNALRLCVAEESPGREHGSPFTAHWARRASSAGDGPYRGGST